VTSFRISRHAGQRMQQRGIRKEDVNLILEWGTSVDDDVTLLREKDVDCAIRQREPGIDRLRRLCGTKVVYREGVIVTCYRATEKQAKRMLRRARHRHEPQRQRTGKLRWSLLPRRSIGAPFRDRILV